MLANEFSSIDLTIQAWWVSEVRQFCLPDAGRWTLG